MIGWDQVGDGSVFDGNPRIEPRLHGECGGTRYARFDGAAWRLEVVDGTGDGGAYTSLALDVGQHPVERLGPVTNGRTELPPIDLEKFFEITAPWRSLG